MAMSPEARKEERYEAELMAQRDRQAMLKASYEEGLQVGLLKSIQKWLNVQYGPTGLDLLPRIRLLQDSNWLHELLCRILSTTSIQEVEAALASIPAEVAPRFGFTMSPRI